MTYNELLEAIAYGKQLKRQQKKIRKKYKMDDHGGMYESDLVETRECEALLNQNIPGLETVQ